MQSDSRQSQLRKGRLMLKRTVWITTNLPTEGTYLDPAMCHAFHLHSK